MKLKIFLLAIVASTCAISFNSCTKNNSDGSSTSASANAQTEADDQTLYTSAADYSTNDANAALSSSGGKYNERPTGVDSASTSLPWLIFPCDGSIVTDTLTNPRTITITYNGFGCNPFHIVRTGSIILSFDSSFKWGVAGSQLTITFNNVKIKRNFDGKTLLLNGKRIVTNTSGGLLKDLDSIGTSSIVHSIVDTMSITFDNGSQRTWQTALTRTFTYNAGEVITTTGGLHGINRFGNNFSSTITPGQPLVVAESCDYRYISGQYVHVNNVGTSTTTFGLDASGTAVNTCETTLYYSFDWLGTNGKTFDALGSY